MSHISRVVFERGLQLIQSNSHEWLLETESASRRFVSIRAFSDEFKVRPIVMTIHDDTRGERDDLLSGNISPYDSRLRRLEFACLVYGQSYPTALHTVNLHNAISAVTHHCVQLANSYVRVLCEYRLNPQLRDWHRASNSKNEYHLPIERSEPYFEFESLVTAVRRTYEFARYIIWRAFSGSRDNTPRSFLDTLESCKKLPPDLRSRLASSWEQCGKKVAAYRDCVQHYVCISGGFPRIRLDRLEGGIWACSALIPDNPEARSHRSFRYDTNIDALQYGWQVTEEILQVTRTILDFLPDSKTLLNTERFRKMEPE